MSIRQIIKQPPVRRARRKKKALVYLMVKRGEITTIATTLPKVVQKGG